ncbi:Acg family FMN-binding oxidoreductase [Saccharopolyspora endophytica]|uniref:Nitroreductase n=1 Tax=Saccharopolyspora endophytica TaxID=543886 RepID=A0ABS5DF82_9PSEU|nr:hypothetical protein [Saccharopolyspora endophytica]MBQ0924951.1 hypothetical protein [Saccharopolyspora endophytica]
MSYSPLSAQDAREVRGLAGRAPSLFNLQPWRFREAAGALELLLDGTVALPATDPDRRELVISCGAALHLALLSLRARGWRPRVQRLPSEHDADLLARIDVLDGKEDPAPSDRALVRAAQRRHVDRRQYAPTAVPQEVLLDLVSEDAVASVSVLTGDQRYAVAQAFTKAAMIHAGSDAYRAELAAWSGLTPPAARGVLDESAPWHGQRYGDVVVRDFGYAETVVREAGSALTAGSLLLISTGTDDRDAHLRAGEALGAVLCQAELGGLSSCPLSEAFEVPRTRADVRHQVLGDEGHPQMVVRVGWPQSADLPAGTAPIAPELGREA